MRAALILLIGVLTPFAAERLTLGKPAPHFSDVTARTVVLFEPISNEILQKLELLGMHAKVIRDKTIAGAYGATSGERVALLVDERSVLRRVVRRKEDPSEFASTVLREMSAWDDGKSIYEGQCARCHGDDGNGTNYPNIKKLGGIGNRLTELQIAEATGQVGTVDLTVLGERVKSLAAYVAGL